MGSICPLRIKSMKINFPLALLFLILQSLTLNAQSQDDYDNWNQSLAQGTQYYNLQAFDQSVFEFETAYDIALKLFEIDSQEFVSTAYSYAVVLVQIEDNARAQAPMEKALEGIQKLYGDKSQEYATALTIMANIYVGTKTYKKAEEIYIESNDLMKSSYGDQHYLYGIGLTNLAGFYREIGDYKLALQILDQGLNILKDNPDFDQRYYNNLRYNNLPEIYQGLGRLDDALKIEEESLDYLRRSIGKYSSNYANVMTSIGGIHVNLGNFNKAEKALEEAAQIFEELGNFEDEEALGNVYMFLVACYSETSDYKKAFYYASKGIELTGLDSDNPPSNALNYYEILGKLNWDLGNFEDAKYYLQKAIEGTVETIGLNAPELPLLKSELGLCYRELQEEDEAVQLIREGFKMAQDQGLTIKDKVYRQCLENLSMILVDQEKFSVAIENLEMSLKEEDRSYPNYWLKVVDLANVYMQNNQCKEASQLLEEGIGRLKKFYGKEDPNYLHALNSSIIANRCQKKYGNIIEQINEADQLTKGQLTKRFSFSTGILKRIFLMELEYSFDVYESVNMDLNNNELAILNLNNQLFLKGLLLSQSKNVTDKLLELNNSNIDAKIDEYLNNKQLLNRLEDNESSLNLEDRNQLESMINRSEIEMVQLHNEYFGNSIDYERSWLDVKKELKEDEVAIEFSRFVDMTNKNQDSTFYVAYLIKKDSDYPNVIHLFEESQLLSILNNKNTPNLLYATRGSGGTSVGKEYESSELYDLIWEPLEPYLADVRSIHFAPVGLLHKIAFASLNKGGVFLINKYILNQLSSTYEIVGDKRSLELDNILLVGGVKYDYEVAKGAIKNSADNQLDIIELTNKRSDSAPWNYLPGTLKEVIDLNEILTSDKKSTQISVGKEANESMLKGFTGNSPSIMHIATHGFFFPNDDDHRDDLIFKSEENKFKTAENPLKRAGLLFSGANLAWIQGNNPYETENGILTAEEISSLDLSKTDMVVLSACETGLGDIDGSEGVYGLQRAFKMAGVDIIVMSLWQVPDKETAEFMTLFYTNWLKGTDVRQAFNSTQKTMQERYKDEPLKWAAFVLFE